MRKSNRYFSFSFFKKTKAPVLVCLSSTKTSVLVYLLSMQTSVLHAQFLTKTYVLTQKQGPRSKKRFVKRGSQSHTGDYTIPYMSLSFAHSWLTEPLVEYRPAIAHKPKKHWAPSAVGKQKQRKRYYNNDLQNLPTH